MRLPPPGWLGELASIARGSGALVCLDEIYTAFGRTGAWFAGPVEGVVPDLLCVGKALGGGFPLSACIGTPRVMDAWGSSSGEAIHTQTFLGHPVGCAAALAVLDVVRTEGLDQRARELGAHLVSAFEQRGYTVRGRGLMLGIELPGSLWLCRTLQRRGYLTLPAGMRAEVLSLTPPASITIAQLDGFLEAFDEAIADGAR